MVVAWRGAGSILPPTVTHHHYEMLGCCNVVNHRYLCTSVSSIKQVQRRGAKARPLGDGGPRRLAISDLDPGPAHAGGCVGVQAATHIGARKWGLITYLRLTLGLERGTAATIFRVARFIPPNLRRADVTGGCLACADSPPSSCA